MHTMLVRGTYSLFCRLCLSLGPARMLRRGLSGWSWGTYQWLPPQTLQSLGQANFAISCLQQACPQQNPCSACLLSSAPQHGGRQQQHSSYATLISTARAAQLCSATCPPWCTCLPCRLPSPREVPETSLSLMNSIVTAVRSSITAMGRRMGVGLPPVLRKVLDSELCKVHLKEWLRNKTAIERGMGVGLILLLCKALDGGAAKGTFAGTWHCHSLWHSSYEQVKGLSCPRCCTRSSVASTWPLQGPEQACQRLFCGKTWSSR